jgi:hypothetical protein
MWLQGNSSQQDLGPRFLPTVPDETRPVLVIASALRETVPH